MCPSPYGPHQPFAIYATRPTSFLCSPHHQKRIDADTLVLEAAMEQPNTTCNVYIKGHSRLLHDNAQFLLLLYVLPLESSQLQQCEGGRRQCVDRGGMKYGEITHFNHPQHKLRFEYVEVPFKCDGCKEVGIGSRFKCALCDYDLHKHCALPSTGILYHPFYRKCAFQFLARPPGDAPRFCNACEKDVNGFVYHCRACGFDLHPCCANLPHTLDAGDGLRLYLYRKVGAPCHRCGRKGRSWSYRSTCKKYNLHVSCVMEMLVESWQEIYFGGGAYAGGAGGYAAGGFGSVARKVEGGYGGITKMNRIPSIRGTAQNRHRRKGKVKKCCELAGMAVQFIISAVLGDPTAIIAGVIGSFISR